MHKTLSLACVASFPFILNLQGDFVFDDSEAIVKNKDVFAESWLQPFKNDFWGTDIKSNLSHKSYRPLTVTTFRLNYFLNGKDLSAIQFKIINLIGHTTSCLFIWKAVLCLLNIQNTKSMVWWKDTAFLTSLLFAVHPVHVEAVSGIVGRADVLAANVFFLAFITYYKATQYRRWASYLYLQTTVILSVIGMLFKENGITVLGFCIFYEVCLILKDKVSYGKNSNYKNKRIHIRTESLLRMLFNITFAIVILYGRWIIMGGSQPSFKATDNPAAFSENYFTKIRTYNYIYFLNFLLLIWPHWLCYDWSLGCVQLLDSNLDYRNIFTIVLYISGILLSLAIKRNNDFKLLQALALIAIPFLPAANIFYPVGFVIAERILYISSAGYCLLITIGFQRMMKHSFMRNHKVGTFLFLLLLVTYSLKSWQRSADWKNEYNLFISGLHICPLNAKVHYNVAKAADAKHQYDWALMEYKEAIRLYPNYYQAMNNLANMLKNQGEYLQAEQYLRRATHLKNDFPAAWMNLGIVLANLKKFNESELAYKSAIKHRSNYPDCYYNLGNLYLQMNKKDDAVKSWLHTIYLNKKHVLAWTNLLAMLDNSGKLDMALKIIPKALEDVPDSPSIIFAIANIYGKLDRYEEAEQYFLRAINLFGEKVQAIHYANLGVLYHRWKKYNAAEEMYKRALKTNPRFNSALVNMNNLQKIKDK